MATLYHQELFETDLSLYNEGVKCIKKGQGVYGQWDTASGQTRGEWVTTNANLTTVVWALRCWLWMGRTFRLHQRLYGSRHLF